MSTLGIITALLALLNLISFSMMAYDKHCAKAGKWRVPEKWLFILTACFGGLGGVLGMIICHHKTRHWYFKLFFPMLLLIQIVLLILGYQKFFA